MIRVLYRIDSGMEVRVVSMYDGANIIKIGVVSHSMAEISMLVRISSFSDRSSLGSGKIVNRGRAVTQCMGETPI